jgi:hypothetical protein
MVAVVLLTTLLTPIALRAAFHLKSVQDLEEGLTDLDPKRPPTRDVPRAILAESESLDPPRNESSFKVVTPSASMLTLTASEAASDLE